MVTNKEREFLFDLAELMAKHEVSIEPINSNIGQRLSISFKKANGEIDIHLYSCLYPADIMNMAKVNEP